MQGDRAYRIERAADDRLVLMQRDEGGDWGAQYDFSLTPRVYADYAEMCRYHQTSRKSHFAQHRTVSLATPGGRVTLTQTRLSEYPIPESLDHRDLHDENAFVEGERDLFLDWGDSSGTHPFFSPLSVWKTGLDRRRNKLGERTS